MKYVAVILIIALFISGCSNPIYTKSIENAYSELKIGMAKTELDDLFGRFEFLKEQAILMYPNSTEDDMRHSLLNDHYYEDLYPKNVFNKVTFDGKTKVFSYLTKKELNWPNGWLIYYIAVFYNEKDNKVIGWAKIITYGEAKTWRENF